MCVSRYFENKLQFDKACLMTVYVSRYDDAFLRCQYIQVTECLQVIPTRTIYITAASNTTQAYNL